MVLEKRALSHFRQKKDFENMQEDVFFMTKMTHNSSDFFSYAAPQVNTKVKNLVSPKMAGDAYLG